jgi:hypothetical protein
MATVVARASRRRSRWSWAGAGAALVVSAAVAGAAQGAVLQQMGVLLGLHGDLVRAAAALPLAVVVLLAVRRTPWQVPGETPRSWLALPGLSAPVLNGLALGSGAFTRIGFWLFYVLLVLALLAPHPALAALDGAVYGAVRTVLPLLVAPRHDGVPDAVAPTLLWKPAAVRIDGAMTVLTSAAASVLLAGRSFSLF